MYSEMLFKYFVLVSIFFKTTSANNVSFKLSFNRNNESICEVPSTVVQVTSGDDLHVSVAGEYDEIHHAFCSLINKTKIFLSASHFERPTKSAIYGTVSVAEIKNTTQMYNGKWNCTFLSKRGMTLERFVIYGGENYTQFNCTVQVKVHEPPPTLEIERDILYYIIGGVGGLVLLLVVIALTICILYIKAKAKIPNELPHLQRRTFRRDDQTRYSTMPGEKKRKKTQKQRQESGIYQSLENLTINAGRPPSVSPTPCIKNRPPMPLPEDEEHIYDDDHTLHDVSSPPSPPAVDTLPRRKWTHPGSKPPAPAPVQTDMYDYADTMELLQQTNDISKRPGKPTKNTPPQKPIKPKAALPPPTSAKPKPEFSSVPKISGKPTMAVPGGMSMMHELGNRLKSQNNAHPITPQLRQPSPSTPQIDPRRPEIQSETRSQNVKFNKNPEQTQPKSKCFPSWSRKPKVEECTPNWKEQSQDQDTAQSWKPQHTQAVSPQSWSQKPLSAQAVPENRPPSPEIYENVQPFVRPTGAFRTAPNVAMQSPPINARSPPVSRVAPMLKTSPSPNSHLRSQMMTMNKPLPPPPSANQEQDEGELYEIPEHCDYLSDDEFDTYDELP